MLGHAVGRNPASALRNWPVARQVRIGPVALGNALGSGLVDAMTPQNSAQESFRQGEIRQQNAQWRDQQWISQSDAIQARRMNEAAAPYREQQWISQSDAIMARRAAEALDGRNGMDVQSDAWVAANGQGKIGYRTLTPPVRANSAASERQRELNRFSEMGAASGAAPVWNMRAAAGAQRLQAAAVAATAVGSGSPGQYISASTGDGLSPIERYLRGSLGGLDPLRANRFEIQAAFSLQDAAVSEAGGLVVGAGLKLAGIGLGAARGAMLSDQSLLRAELSTELQAALRADLRMPTPLAGVSPGLGSIENLSSTSMRPVPRVDVSNEFVKIPRRDGGFDFEFGDPTTHGLFATINRNGVLTMDIRANAAAALERGTGTDMAASLMNRLEREGVEVVQFDAQWMKGSKEVSANYSYFNKMKNSIGELDAARGTWTGKFFAQYGFDIASPPTIVNVPNKTYIANFIKVKP